MNAAILPGALASAVAVAGCAALLARPALLPAGHDPTARLTALFVVLGAIGVFWPLRAAAVAAERRCLPPAATAAGVLALGALAFVAGWLVMGGPAGSGTLLFHSVALNGLAAVAEEAFFRRLVFGLLLAYGTPVAVAGSAVAFAVVHLGVWGFWVLPLDLAAGLLLSWQRAASGRWSVPAATHVLANTLALA